jgi:GT2 family glycosyltransferase
VDFALRARRRGWLSYFVDDARVYHAGGVSSHQIGGRRLYYSLSSRSLFAFRHWRRWKARLLVALTVSVELTARTARAVVHGNHTELRDTAAGYGAYLRWLCRPPHPIDHRSAPWTSPSV